MIQVRRYVAPSYAEALIHAKRELGSEAVIVDTRKVETGGFLGFFRRSATELTVAIDTSQTSTTGVQSADTLSRSLVAGVERELSALRTAITEMAGRRSGSEPHTLAGLTGVRREACLQLINLGVAESSAVQLVLGLREGESQAALVLELTRKLGPAGGITILPGKRRVVALVGPTGVGKTTTLAKLAAQFTLEQNLKVGLITADTFRIAAVEQLRTYASILGLPIYPVDTCADIAAALKATNDCDLVLADTGGRSHRDKERMQELRDILAILRPDETHLVISLTANLRDVLEAVEAYTPLGADRLTFTKLDEATAPGMLFTVPIHCGLPVSYITCGQSVPDDIRLPDHTEITSILAGGLSHG